MRARASIPQVPPPPSPSSAIMVHVPLSSSRWRPVGTRRTSIRGSSLQRAARKKQDARAEAPATAGTICFEARGYAHVSMRSKPRTAEAYLAWSPIAGKRSEMG